MALTEGSMKGGSGVKKRPPTTEYHRTGYGKPEPRTQKDGVDYSLAFLAVSFFVFGFMVGSSFA